jgi:hypothetical protein
MTTRLLNPQPWPYLAVSLGALLGVACASKTADLGQDRDAAAGAYPTPIYATTPPPTAADGGVPAATGTPWKLVERSAPVETFGVDGGVLYWFASFFQRGGGGMYLYRCNVDDCASTLMSWCIVANMGWGGDNTVPSIAFDAEFAYWPDQGGEIGRCPRDNCSSYTRVNPSAPADWFVLDGPDLFLSATGALLRCSAGNCDATLTRVPLQAPLGVAPFTGAKQMVADQDYLYLATEGHVTADYRILRARKDGTSAFEVLAENSPESGAAMGGIALSGDSMFWTEWTEPGSVKACLKSGCAGEPRVVVGGLHSPQFLAADADRVYIVESPTLGPDRLLSCPLAGCSEPTVLIQNAGIHGKVLVDDRFVYVMGDDPALMLPQQDPVTGSSLPETPGFIAVLPK